MTILGRKNFCLWYIIIFHFLLNIYENTLLAYSSESFTQTCSRLWFHLKVLYVLSGNLCCYISVFNNQSFAISKETLSTSHFYKIWFTSTILTVGNNIMMTHEIWGMYSKDQRFFKIIHFQCLVTILVVLCLTMRW